MPKKQQNKLRLEAKGRECQVRVTGACNGNRETVVLAHLNNKRLFGVGTGQKVPDMFGAWACSSCHDYIDGRVSSGCLTQLAVNALFYEACFRTMNILLSEGKIGETL